MDLPKQNKMMLVFATWKNPLLESSIQPADRNKKALAAMLGVSQNTIGNWREGHPIATSTAEGVFRRAIELVKASINNEADCADILMRIEQFKVIYHSKPENPLYDSVAILRMPVDECQNIIDEAIYERLPLFPEMFYDTVYGGVNAAEDAARDYNDYKGLYDSWIKRDKVWLRSPLRVRYPLKLRHGVIIRAKLNIPMIEREEGSPQTYWEYDGFLAVKGHNRRLFWTFEQRNQRNNDYMYFITDFGRQIQSANGHHLTMAGVYLTTGQDEHRSIVTSDIVMRRIPGTDVNAMERLMHETAGVVDKAAEIKEVEDLLIACRSQRH